MRKQMKADRKEMVCGFLGIIVFLIALGICGNYECHYKMDGVITNVDNEIVTVVDTRGEEWSFEGDGYTVNDKVRLTMYTAHTDNNIYDDEVTNVKIVNSNK